MPKTTKKRPQRSKAEQRAESIEQILDFVADLCDAILWTDGIDWGDTDKPLPALIDGFYADRAESRVTPKQSY